VKRKRGILLSSRGWQRLQAAELAIANQERGGKSYTLQELSQRTGLSPNTLTRVRSRKVAVDYQTLEYYFRAFDLNLLPDDYLTADVAGGAESQYMVPNGQLLLDSPFYIQRPPIEQMCYQGISQPGGLVRIKAPRHTGKTSLVARTLMQVREEQWTTVMLNCRLADTGTFETLERFLQWLCAVVAHHLGYTTDLRSQWDNLFGASYSCTRYFESVLLQDLQTPLVLALDEVDTIFEHPQIASDVFGMLQAWHEKARYGDNKSLLWQKLRLVLVHSREAYIPLNLSQSPFNAGLLVDVPNFNHSQVEELARCYNVDNPAHCAQELMRWMDGFPYLVHCGLHYLSFPGTGLATLLGNVTAPDNIYAGYLRNQLWHLQKSPELMQLFKQVVFASEPIKVPPLQAYKLQSQGLVKFHHQALVPSCELYRQYFSQIFAMLES
jgi:transcriptional regulator with XRE-family HTH domain